MEVIPVIGAPAWTRRCNGPTVDVPSAAEEAMPKPCGIIGADGGTCVRVTEKASVVYARKM
jgi:hypothetical protein